MDGIIGLGHFCETHGPCIILSTQKNIKQQNYHIQNQMSCDACQSLKENQVLVSKDDSNTYLTSRVPLQEQNAFLLKQVAIRSLSCEQESTFYFGDDRGHVCSHCFMLHDSLARGFQRKYVILVLMQDKLSLLNVWKFISENFKDIASELTAMSLSVNNNEQKMRSQRAVRHLQNSSVSVTRSLGQLTGKPTIYAHLHYWFTWVLGCPSIAENPTLVNKLPLPTLSPFLRTMFQQLGETNFNLVFGSYLSGINIDCDDEHFLNALNSIWPATFEQRPSRRDKFCKILLSGNNLVVESNCNLPFKSTQMQKLIVDALGNENISDKVLQHQINAIVTSWIHISHLLKWCPKVDLTLLRSINIQKHDLPVLEFLISNEHVVNNLKLLLK